MARDGIGQHREARRARIRIFSQQELVRRLLGRGIADRVGQVWGIGEDGELAERIVVVSSSKSVDEAFSRSSSRCSGEGFLADDVGSSGRSV